MLEIINNLKPFFEDCYRRINVREYARIMRISAPTASTLLDSYEKLGLLIREEYKNYILYHANIESKDFIDLSRIYWRHILKDLVIHIENKIPSATIILFGSLARAEVKKDSDIDLVIFAEKIDINIKLFEKKLNREIQHFFFNSLKDIKNKELANNVINGYVLRGRLVI